MKKPKVKTKMLQLAIEPALKIKLFEKAREQGVSLSEATRQAIEIWSGFDLATRQQISEFSDRLGISEPVVIQNIVVRYFAEKAAMDEVWGDAPGVLTEFSLTPSGPLTGEQLKDFLTDNFRAQFEREREKILEAHEQYGNSPEEQKWLDDRRQKKRQPSLTENLKDLPPERREIALEGFEHHKKCKEIEKTEGEEAALAFHQNYLKRKSQRRSVSPHHKDPQDAD